jgi:hypothetical protein
MYTKDTIALRNVGRANRGAMWRTELQVMRLVTGVRNHQWNISTESSIDQDDPKLIIVKCVEEKESVSGMSLAHSIPSAVKMVSLPTREAASWVPSN